MNNSATRSFSVEGTSQINELSLGRYLVNGPPLVGDEIQHKNGQTFVVKGRKWMHSDDGLAHIHLTLVAVERG